MAAYDEDEHTGMLKWLGIVTGGGGSIRTVRWVPSNAQIWIDTPPGRGFWKAGPFAFAATKIAGYGLHELWQESFGGMELRDHAQVERREPKQRAEKLTCALKPPKQSIPKQKIAVERLKPIEVIGEPTTGHRAGVVYVLKSAYGYKVGRTNKVPARMRAFGVHLPFIYTIPLCAWFNDCHEAERKYHHRFAEKRINGEWFDLNDEDVAQIRMRA